MSASSSSPGPMPAVASTTKATRSASAMAARAWSATSDCMALSSPASTPPVSMTAKAWPPHSTTSSLRSRVTPGAASTTASRVCVRRLMSVDLPTLGKPTTATVPSRVLVVGSSGASSPRPARARGGRRALIRRARRCPAAERAGGGRHGWRTGRSAAAARARPQLLREGGYGTASPLAARGTSASPTTTVTGCQRALLDEDRALDHHGDDGRVLGQRDHRRARAGPSPIASVAWRVPSTNMPSRLPSRSTRARQAHGLTVALAPAHAEHAAVRRNVARARL